MKTKIFFLVAILISTFSICNAQHRVSENNNIAAYVNSPKSAASRSGVSIAAGANIATVSDIDDADSKAGIYLSIGYTSSVDGSYIGTLTADYTRGGYKLSYDGTDIKANLDYIGFQGKFLFGVTDNFYLGLGYGLNFLVSAKAEYDGETSDMEDVSTADMVIPLCARYYMGANKNIFLDASYNLGVFSVFGDDSSIFGDYCNRGFILSVGVKL